MRTTVTLEADVEALVQRAMRERSISFKEALNSAVRAGLATTREPAAFRTPTYSLGPAPAVPLDQALRLAGQLEDEELRRRLATRK